MGILREVIENLGVEIEKDVFKDWRFEGKSNNFDDVLYLLSLNNDITEEQEEIIDGIIEYQYLKEDSEKMEILEKVYESDFDFEGYDYIEFSGGEIRIIPDSEIEEVHRDTIKEIVEDCYDLNLDNIPSFVAFEIDWDKTADNCLADGYGHTFSSYDGSEHETKNYYYFRII